MCQIYGYLLFHHVLQTCKNRTLRRQNKKLAKANLMCVAMSDKGRFLRQVLHTLTKSYQSSFRSNGSFPIHGSAWLATYWLVDARGYICRKILHRLYSTKCALHKSRERITVCIVNVELGNSQFQLNMPIDREILEQKWQRLCRKHKGYLLTMHPIPFLAEGGYL